MCFRILTSLYHLFMKKLFFFYHQKFFNEQHSVKLKCINFFVFYTYKLYVESLLSTFKRDECEMD